MSERSRLLWLAVIMMAAVAVSTAVAVAFLYRTAFEQTRLHLAQTVHEQAALMEALARADGPGSVPAGEGALSVLESAFAHLPEAAQSAEIVVARREGEDIVHLVIHGPSAVLPERPIPMGSGLAEPMRRALSGATGTMVGLDYHGARVLAAYRPVAALGVGIVAKIDLAELRAPYLRAATRVIGLTLLLMTLGTFLFLRLTRPIVRHLDETELRYRCLFHGAPVAIWEQDLSGVAEALDGLKKAGVTSLEAYLADRPRELDRLIGRLRVKEVNAAALKLFGADSAGRLREWVPSHLLAACRVHCVQVLEAVWDGRETLVHRRVSVTVLDGREREVVLTALIPDADAGYRSVLAAALDVSADAQLRRREAELVQAQKMEVVGQLSGAIAHDFNNLLTVILTDLSLLRRELQGPQNAELGELLDDAASAAQDGATLTRRLLAFARKQPLEPQWVDLDAFIEHTGRFLRRVAGTDVELVVARGGGPLAVRVDRQQLENTLLNLAINARDAMPDGGTLTLETARRWVAPAEPDEGRLAPGSYAVIHIRDTGVGMSPETLRRACEPFYSTKAIGKGSGLGLSTALGFAQQSGGDLRISSAEGQGTTVTLYLPEAEPAQTDPGEPLADLACAPSAQVPASILVVDDDVRARRCACQGLSALGHRVVEAADAAAAIRILESDPGIDLLVTDLVMPGKLDGRGLARWARQHCPRLRVLLVSGFPPKVSRAQGEGAEAFLAKPYSERQLAAAIGPLLNPPRS